jgi:hypothetical protein
VYRIKFYIQLLHQKNLTHQKIIYELVLLIQKHINRQRKRKVIMEMRKLAAETNTYTLSILTFEM